MQWYTDDAQMIKQAILLCVLLKPVIAVSDEQLHALNFHESRAIQDILVMHDEVWGDELISYWALMS